MSRSGLETYGQAMCY